MLPALLSRANLVSYLRPHLPRNTSDVCIVVCDKGYKTVAGGVSTVICSTAGVFCGNGAAECVAIKCASRPVTNGKLRTGSTGDACTIACDRGCTPVGTLSCNASGVFDGDGSCLA